MFKDCFERNAERSVNKGKMNLVLVDNETGTQEWYEWYHSSILEGSYFYIKKGEGSSKDELTIDIRCKDKDGTVHHIQAEYNVYR